MVNQMAAITLVMLHVLDNTHLDAATIEAFNPPKQEKATATGIVQLKIPNTWSANVCEIKN